MFLLSRHWLLPSVVLVLSDQLRCSPLNPNRAAPGVFPPYRQKPSSAYSQIALPLTVFFRVKMRIRTNFRQLPGVSNFYRGEVRTCLIPKTRCVSSSSCSRISTRLTTSRGGCCAAPRTRKTLRKKPCWARTNSFPALVGETRALGFSRLCARVLPLDWEELPGGEHD